VLSAGGVGWGGDVRVQCGDSGATFHQQLDTAEVSGTGSTVEGSGRRGGHALSQAVLTQELEEECDTRRGASVGRGVQAGPDGSVITHIEAEEAFRKPSRARACGL